MDKVTKVPCEIWSRPCGFFRPVSSYNKGKAEEFRERKTIKLTENQKEYVNDNMS